MTTAQGAEITEAQAAEALDQLITPKDVESESPAPVAEQPAKVETAPDDEKAPAQETAQEAAPQEEVAEEVDDVVSLKKRLEESEGRIKLGEEQHASRLRALQERNTENERILRDRYLRKSTATDKALKVLRAAKSEAGVEPAEADRVIQELESTMNPASASYVPQEPRAAASEDQTLILNAFLNEKGMTGQEADKFGNWIRSDAATAMSLTEQAVVNESLDGFLRIAHSRWQEGVREGEKKQKVDDAVGAVRSVQRTQREAARAASASPSAPRKQPAGPKDHVDIEKLTDKDISTLLRQSVEQYR